MIKILVANIHTIRKKQLKDGTCLFYEAIAHEVLAVENCQTPILICKMTMSIYKIAIWIYKIAISICKMSIKNSMTLAKTLKY